MLPALGPTLQMIGLCTVTGVGCCLIMLGAAMLIMDLTDPMVRKAAAAVACGGMALGLALIIASVSSLGQVTL